MPDGKVIFDVRVDDSKVEKDLNQANKTVKNKSKKLLDTSKKVALGIGAAFGSGTAAAVKFGSEFEASFAKASTLFGDVAVNTDIVRNKILDLSDESGVAASELNEGFYSALSAGIPITENADEAIAFMTKSTKLAKAGFTDVDTAISATAKTLNAYGLDVSEVDRIQGILVQTQNKGIVTVGELGSILSNVTPTAAALGVEFEQIGAAMATMTAAGIPAGSAASSLNQLLIEMSKSGTKADQALRQATSGMKTFNKEKIDSARKSNAAAEAAFSKRLSKQLKERQKALDKERKLLSKSLDQESKLLEKNKDQQIKDAEEVFNKKKKLIDKEFLERLKITDEERYNQLKVIDDRINSIEKLTEEEERAIEEKENQEKMAELEKRVNEAKSREERREAEKELIDFRAELERKALLEQRSMEIENLKASKDNINEEFDAKKDAIKNEFKEAKEANKKEFNLAKENINKIYDEQKQSLDELHDLKLEEFDEAKEAELDHIREVNEARTAGFRESNAEAIKGMEKLSSGKGFKDLIEEGKTITEILDILGVSADASDQELADMFGSVEAGKAALSLAAEEGASFNANLEAMRDTTGVVDDAFEKVANTTKEKFAKNIEQLKNFLTKAFLEMQKLVNGIFLFIEAAKNGETWVKLLGIAIATVTTLVIAFNIQQALATSGMTLWAAVGTGATAVTTALGVAFAFLTSPIGLVILAIGSLIAIGVLLKDNWAEISAFLEETWLLIQETAIAIWEPIKEFFTTLFTAISEFIVEKWTLIRDFVIGVITKISLSIKKSFTDAKNNVIEAVTLMHQGLITAFGNIKSLFSELTDFIKNVFTGNWEGALQNVQNIFGRIFGGLRELATKPLNYVIDKINKFIEGVNEIEFPDWVPGLGGKSVGIKLIPKLAKGGLAFGETTAIVGDNPNANVDPEVIAPLSKLKNMMMDVIPNLSMNQQNAFNINLKTTVEMDGVEVAETVMNNLDESRQFF